MSNKKSMVKNENFMVIHGWMINELDLKGNELLIYAIIYGFSQAENQFFTGTAQYLADWTNSTRRGVMKNLSSLVEKGLLQKKEQSVDGVKLVHYRAVGLSEYKKNNLQEECQQSSQGDMNKVHRGYEQSSQGGMNKVHRGYEQSSHPTIYNINNKINNNITSSATENGGDSGDNNIPKNENNIKEDSKVSKQEEKIPYTEILKLYNEICKSLPKALRLSEKRRKAIKAKLRDGYSMDDIKRAFEMAEKSPFLRGEVNKSFHADFDWIFQSDHILRILEDKYKDRNAQNQYTNPTVSVEGHNEEFLRLNGLIP